MSLELQGAIDRAHAAANTPAHAAAVAICEMRGVDPNALVQLRSGALVPAWVLVVAEHGLGHEIQRGLSFMGLL